LPILIGTSRKIFIGKITRKDPRQRVFGTAASVVAAISRGAHIVRVHDVDEMADVVRVADAIYSTRRV
jgi:dihydropteroate synthase